VVGINAFRTGKSSQSLAKSSQENLQSSNDPIVSSTPAEEEPVPALATLSPKSEPKAEESEHGIMRRMNELIFRNSKIPIAR
jgi:hypothetical protein